MHQCGNLEEHRGRLAQGGSIVLCSRVPMVVKAGIKYTMAFLPENWDELLLLLPLLILLYYMQY